MAVLHILDYDFILTTAKISPTCPDSYDSIFVESIVSDPNTIEFCKAWMKVTTYSAYNFLGYAGSAIDDEFSALISKYHFDQSPWQHDLAFYKLNGVIDYVFDAQGIQIICMTTDELNNTCTVKFSIDIIKREDQTVIDAIEKVTADFMIYQLNHKVGRYSKFKELVTELKAQLIIDNFQIWSEGTSICCRVCKNGVHNQFSVPIIPDRITAEIENGQSSGPLRENCPMRHKENGNCLVAGGFCTAVNDEICQALHRAYQYSLQNKDAGSQDVGEIVKSGRIYPFCSKCDSSLERSYFKYCPYCGVKFKENT